jgi:hypothetical protein
LLSQPLLLLLRLPLQPHLLLLLLPSLSLPLLLQAPLQRPLQPLTLLRSRN